mgnify:CR=1 FL=1
MCLPPTATCVVGGRRGRRRRRRRERRGRAKELNSAEVDEVASRVCSAVWKKAARFFLYFSSLLKLHAATGRPRCAPSPPGCRGGGRRAAGERGDSTAGSTRHTALADSAAPRVLVVGGGFLLLSARFAWTRDASFQVRCRAPETSIALLPIGSTGPDGIDALKLTTLARRRLLALQPAGGAYRPNVCTPRCSRSACTRVCGPRIFPYATCQNTPMVAPPLAVEPPPAQLGRWLSATGR